jgi:HEAT repeat protein
MFETLINSLLNKNLLSVKQAKLLQAMNLATNEQIAELLNRSVEKEVIFALLDMCAWSGYVSQLIKDENLIQSIVRLLGSPDWQIRHKAAQTIGRLDLKEQLQTLSNIALYDENDDVKVIAIDAISIWRLPGSAPVLISIVNDSSLPVKVRETAIEALGISGSSDAIIPLIAQLQSEISRIRYAAVIALNNARDASVIPHLEQLLSDKAQVNLDGTIGEQVARTIQYLQRV